MKKRIVVNKPQNIKCEMCQKEVSLYSMSTHLKFSHKICADVYTEKYGEFRKPKRKKNPSGRIINKIECKLCGKNFPSVGMYTHLRDTHDISVDEYCKKYGEYRPSKLREYEYHQRLKTSNDKQTCVICGQIFASGNLLGGHIKRDHLMSKRKYVLECVFKGIHPTCNCGCGRKVKILYYSPYKVDYISGHNSMEGNNPMYGKKHSKSTKLKMSHKAIIRITTQIGKKIDTKPELEFKKILDDMGIAYEHPYEIKMNNRNALVDFYLTDSNIPIEIDGLYWHPEKLEGLNFHRIPNVISDYEKKDILNLVRIKDIDISKIKSAGDIKKYSYDVTYTLEYKQKIIEKEYFSLCMEKKGLKYLKGNSWLLLKFLRLFQPELPYPDLEENMYNITKKIASIDLNRIYNSETKTFSNNISTAGHNYLKHYFHSYWNSNYNGNPTAKNAWLDDKIMNEVILYRIGCNNSGEVFDFSLHQIVRGLSARRITVSFFKPMLAAAIYKHHLGNVESPVVLDPCAGFGGRLVGFQSIYPNGTYIGVEPNTETFKELSDMVKRENWNNVMLINKKFEDVDINLFPKADLAFTSIPYFDKEIYSDGISYSSFNEWKNSFISALERIPYKTLINTEADLAEKIGWVDISSYIQSNKSHFTKNYDKKPEVIVCL